MKIPLRSLLVSVAFSLGVACAQAQKSPQETPSKEKVTKLDGTSLFGLVTLTDDYTLRISNDSGIFNIPLALLGEKDFKRYTSGKDRSQDGKLWSDRQDALEGQQQKNAEKGGEASKGNSAIEIQLAEISVFQPAIALYEAATGGKSPAQSAKGGDSKKQDSTSESSENSAPVRLFSGPVSGGNLPLNAPGSSLVQPVLSTGAAVLQSAGAVTPGIPTAP